MDTKKELENFMRNVVWLRKHHNISKKNMAKLLEIGVGSLTKIENGEIPKRMTINVFFNIHKHFGIAPKEQLSVLLCDKEK